MGNQQCNECKETLPESQAYGSYDLLHENTRIYAVVEKKVQKDPILQKKVLNQLKLRKQIRHSHIVCLHKYHLEEQLYGFKVIMCYQYIPKSLRNRIEQLQAKSQQFSEKQLFAIIYGIQSALLQLNKNNIKHCCINLDTILCKNNFYKLTDVSSTTYVSSYDLVAKGNQEQFLSEKLLDFYSHKSLAPEFQLKDDIFSLGMISLMLGSNKKISDLYSWDQKGNGSLNMHTINLCLKNIQKNYSSKLVRKIKSLLFDPETGELSKSDNTNISDSLHELQQQMSRVLGRVKNVSLVSSYTGSSRYS